MPPPRPLFRAVGSGSQRAPELGCVAPVPLPPNEDHQGHVSTAREQGHPAVPTLCDEFLLASRQHLSRAEVDRLRGPAGLSIGALTPPEIALAIVAEMTATRRGVNLSGPLADWSGSGTECLLESLPVAR